MRWKVGACDTRVEANVLIILAKRGVRPMHRCALYMGPCYTWNFTWVVIIVIRNSRRTDKNSGGLVKNFRRRSCGPLTFANEVRRLIKTISFRFKSLSSLRSQLFQPRTFSFYVRSRARVTCNAFWQNALAANLPRRSTADDSIEQNIPYCFSCYYWFGNTQCRYYEKYALVIDLWYMATFVPNLNNIASLFFRIFYIF